MSTRRFQFGLADGLSLVTSIAVMTALIMNPDGSIGLWVVMAMSIGVLIYGLVSGRIPAERRRPTRAEVWRLVGAFAGLTLITVVLGTVIIYAILKGSQ
jgi:hypothetical protein